LSKQSEFFKNNPVTATAMIRRSAHQAVGGYDESWRMGFEDWEFWLRCAEEGYWGATIPEYFDWYRTRADHSDRWQCFEKENRDRLRKELIEKYATSARRGLSAFYRKPADVRRAPSESAPFQNKLSCRQSAGCYFLFRGLR
jgi:GT2 family glycosyltransferase